MTTRRSVPFLDLARLHASIRHELDEAWQAVLGSSSFVGADTSASFERAFAHAHGLAHAAGVNSGTDAISLALRATGVGPGDRVLVPSMTFVASAEAVLHAGATPIIVDVDPTTGLFDDAVVPDDLLAQASAALPVHLYGNPVPFDRLDRLVGRGLTTVEDAAQAHLATWQGRPVGTIGSAATFSFFPGKNLGALGDAGLVASDDAEVVERIRLLRDHGRTAKHLHEQVGVSSRMDGLQAALLEVKLAHLPEWTRRRRDRAGDYDALLAATEDTGLTLLDWGDGAAHHLLVARADEPDYRSHLQAWCRDHGIGIGIHYPRPLSRQPALRDHWRPTPHAERLAATVLSLPLDPLMSTSDVEHVVATIAAGRHAWTTRHGPGGRG